MDKKPVPTLVIEVFPAIITNISQIQLIVHYLNNKSSFM
jgi:hypothetical protein